MGPAAGHVHRSRQRGITRFAYARLATAAERHSLDDYVSGLGRVPLSAYARTQQLPFWLNLYNALTVKLIPDHYLVASIRDIDISPGLFADGPWGKTLISVEGEAVSLDDIEHRILRPIWADPRVHYGVNCASLGCPNLPPLAFTAANSGRLLDKGARAFVNHPRGARVDRGRLVVSSIYVWFQESGGSPAGTLSFFDGTGNDRIDSNGTVMSDYSGLTVNSYGQAGDDRIEASSALTFSNYIPWFPAARDYLYGGPGDDSYWVLEPTDAAIERPNEGYDTVEVYRTDYTT